MDGFAEGEDDGAPKYGAVEDEGVEFTVFAAGIHAGRKSGEKGRIEFTAGEAGVEDFGIDADSDGAEAGCMEQLSFHGEPRQYRHAALGLAHSINRAGQTITEPFDDSAPEALSRLPTP